MALVRTEVEKVKILFCLDALARGGTELQVKGLIDRLDRDRFAPYLCTLKPSPGELTPDDCPHLALEVPKLFSPGGLGAMWKTARWLRAEKFHVVQTYFQDSTVFGGLAAYLGGVPLRLACFRDLGFWRSTSQDLLMRGIFRKMTGFLANSQAVKDYFAGFAHLDPERIKVIPNGIDATRFPFVVHEGPTADVGIVGNLNRRVKRIDLFIKAAGQLAANHPEITWHVVGQGELLQEFQTLAGRVGLDGKVVFAGRVAEVPEYLSRLQIGVLCSDSEGSSNAILEYMLTGCAVVATRVGGNEEVLDHGTTGLLVPPGDPDSLARAIRQLVEDVPLRRRLARNAREYAEENFGWDRCVAAHENIYLRGN